MSYANYDPIRDIPDLAGKVIVVTGGTSGIGRATILQLIPHHPSYIIFTGRSKTSAEEVISTVNSLIAQHQPPTSESNTTVSPATKISFVPCELSDLDSVKQAGKEILELTNKIDIYIANAALGNGPSGTTPQGYELFFGTNHIGNAALIQLVLPVLDRTSQTNPSSSPVRIITLGSQAVNLFAPKSGILFPLLKTPIFYRFWYLWSMRRYAHSKLASQLYAVELSKRYPKILSITVQQGMVRTVNNHKLTSFMRFGFVVSPGAWDDIHGAWNTLWAATCDIVAKGGWDKLQGKAFLPVAGDEVKMKQGWLAQSGALWDWTEKELMVHGIDTAQ